MQTSLPNDGPELSTALHHNAGTSYTILSSAYWLFCQNTPPDHRS
jgi:hypothetical protein